MKKFILLAAAAAAVCVFCPAARAALTAGGITALDGSGKQRTAFTNLETIALHQQVNNSADSSDMIRFTFTIFNPSGGPVFRHDGNSTRAVPGNSNSQVSLPISRFSGKYSRLEQTTSPLLPLVFTILANKNKDGYCPS